MTRFSNAPSMTLCSLPLYCRLVISISTAAIALCQLHHFDNTDVLKISDRLCQLRKSWLSPPYRCGK
ncbi:hypothetical protein [Fischerella sp. NIES-3754]|uniref:hypothetical protein n=1 Tax=Fischerella sp. NIES-3754 TaxID=1752063 RepID=UPI0015D75463|nr:hypothetical protein [Fischerella sp. NIES-3754]